MSATVLSQNERNGLKVLAGLAGLSAVSASSLLLYLLIGKRIISKKGDRTVSRGFRPIGLFYLTLLFWDVVQAVGWLFTIRWIHRGSVVTGTFCVAQGILKQLDASGTAFAILGMSWCILHDYVFNTKNDIRIKSGMIVWVGMLVVQAVVIIVPNSKLGPTNYYGNAGFWCWIAKEPPTLLQTSYYSALRIVTHYLFYWTATAFSCVTALAYLVSAITGGRLPVDHFWIGVPTRGNGLFRLGIASELTSGQRDRQWGFSIDVQASGRNFSILFAQYLGPLPQPLVPKGDPVDMVRGGAQHDATLSNERHTSESTSLASAWRIYRNPLNNAFKLLLFPFSYAILVIPFSVVRFRSHFEPSSEDIAAAAWFSLTGFVDTLLFVLLKPDFGVGSSELQN